MKKARVLHILLVMLSTAISAAVISSFGWYRSVSRPTSVADLTSEQRQILVEDLLSESPGVFRPAFFNPPMGYTLRPKAKHDIWNDSFTANELGYRTGAAKKSPGTFRVVFVGDSWTYGHGVTEAESFPKVFEKLANEASATGQPIEAWTLALPGYNTVNELSALWFFFAEIQPDAVIICPSTNDQHSTATILPNGSPWRDGLMFDQYGDPHSVTYNLSFFDSLRFRQRWQVAFNEIRAAQDRLAALSIPSFTFFVAIWPHEVVHALVQESGITGPYAIVPGRYCVGDWALPPPLSHGTSRAHAVYARILYEGFAKMMAWPPPGEQVGTEIAERSYFAAPPANIDWTAELDRYLLALTGQSIADSFHPGKGSRTQCAGPIEASSGLMGRATTLLVRRRDGATRLVLTFRRIDDATSLYPLTVTVTIPSFSRSVSHSHELFHHDEATEALEIAIPNDIPVGTALDVIIETDHISKKPDSLAAQSVYVDSIVQH